MVHTFISSFWFRDICIIKIILRFRDLGKSLAASLMRSVFHRSVEEQDSLFFSLTSPWKIHGALLSRKAVCFSCLSGMSHCSYPNTWSSYFWIILWEAQMKRDWLLNRHVAVTRDSLSPFPPFSSTYFCLSGSHGGSSWTSIIPADSTPIQASWGWALHGQVSWLELVFPLRWIKEVSPEITCNLVFKVFSLAVGNESVRKKTPVDRLGWN